MYYTQYSNCINCFCIYWFIESTLYSRVETICSKLDFLFTEHLTRLSHTFAFYCQIAIFCSRFNPIQHKLRILLSKLSLRKQKIRIFTVIKYSPAHKREYFKLNFPNSKFVLLKPSSENRDSEALLRLLLASKNNSILGCALSTSHIIREYIICIIVYNDILYHQVLLFSICCLVDVLILYK